MSGMDNNKVKKYLELIVEAIDQVEEEYFNLTTTYMPNGIVRERVFCYELYHQLRCLQEKNNLTNFSLHGEPDKRGHSDFREQDRKNPDFIFHIPGTMEGNAVIVEVKGRADGHYEEECENDIETIYSFVSKYSYKLGVFILYNHDMQKFKELLATKFKHSNMFEDVQVFKKMYIICKKDSSSATEIENLYDIIIEIGII